jgi:hypothetical protein
MFRLGRVVESQHPVNTTACRNCADLFRLTLLHCSGHTHVHEYVDMAHRINSFRDPQGYLIAIWLGLRYNSDFPSPTSTPFRRPARENDP